MQVSCMMPFSELNSIMQPTICARLTPHTCTCCHRQCCDLLKYAQKRHSCYLLNICNGFLFPCNYNVYISNGQYTIHTILHLAYLQCYKYNKTESVTAYPCMEKLDYNIICVTYLLVLPSPRMITRQMSEMHLVLSLVFQITLFYGSLPCCCEGKLHSCAHQN